MELVLKVLCSECKHYRNLTSDISLCRLDLTENLNNTGGLTICKEWERKQ